MNRVLTAPSVLNTWLGIEAGRSVERALPSLDFFTFHKIGGCNSALTVTSRLVLADSKLIPPGLGNSRGDGFPVPGNDDLLATFHPVEQTASVFFASKAPISRLMATQCSYNVYMEVGIREAKNNLSRLVGAALDSEEVFLTNRGERIAQLTLAARTGQKGRGRGFWKEKIHFYPGWDSAAEDQKIERMFEALSEGSK